MFTNGGLALDARARFAQRSGAGPRPQRVGHAPAARHQPLALRMAVALQDGAQRVSVNPSLAGVTAEHFPGEPLEIYALGGGGGPVRAPARSTSQDADGRGPPRCR
jgi:hypothetical protein